MHTVSFVSLSSKLSKLRVVVETSVLSIGVRGKGLGLGNPSTWNC